ncbi:MAG: phenylalanine--tRNA ligase subunit alpha [Acidobacteriota bacterium]|jgi:phenylalanyl-tRNA synthetase alpha chain|nr:phenylalanine--tRNA ligase subunit alpha [Acidobacteriota bacterium]
MSDTFEELRQGFERDCAAITDAESWKAVRDKYLAREGGAITAAMKRLRTLPKEERPLFGQKMNELRTLVEGRLEGLLQTAKAAEASGRGMPLDVTRPGFPLASGSAHPIKRLQAEIEQIFVGMGFQIRNLPEIETDYYNFEALNMPRNHPARDAQDTFYFDDTVLLRTHCSSVQPHSLEGATPPVRAISTGKVYRRDPFDATHSPMFYQVDVVAVEKGLTMGDLKGTLGVFLQRVFGREVKMRLRPGFFPFVEPGAEVDIGCIFCGGKGCPTCKGSGWIEILGAGMIHPKVLRMSGVDDGVYSGFAWGMGIDRVAILKYGVDDIRLFFENDLRFLQQF